MGMRAEVFRPLLTLETEPRRAVMRLKFKCFAPEGLRRNASPGARIKKVRTRNFYIQYSGFLKQTDMTACHSPNFAPVARVKKVRTNYLQSGGFGVCQLLFLSNHLRAGRLGCWLAWLGDPDLLRSGGSFWWMGDVAAPTRL